MSETSKLPFTAFGATGQQGRAVVDALLDRGALPHESMEIAGDALTADAIAERIGEYLASPAGLRNSR